MPKCKCGTELEYIDVLEDDFENDTTIVVDIEGFCPSCGTRYTWRERYLYSDFEKVEEIGDE